MKKAGLIGRFLLRVGAFSRDCAGARTWRQARIGLLLALAALLQAPGALAQAAAQAPGALTAPAPAPRGTKVIEIKGDIGPALVHTLREALADTEPERFPAGAVLLLDSRGGDGLAAMEIGRIARAARAHVFVRNRCASACTFILAGGVLRGSGAEHAVGIHRPRLTTFVKDVGVVDVDAASNPDAARMLEFANRRSAAYLREMGVPDALFKAMMAVPSHLTKFLSGAELADYGLVGFDAGYRAARAAQGASRYAISEETFVQRTMQVHEKCVADYAGPREFARCYARVLQTGE